MKLFLIVAMAGLLVACQGAKAANDQHVPDKVRSDAEKDRKVKDIQEQWRGQVEH